MTASSFAAAGWRSRVAGGAAERRTGAANGIGAAAAALVSAAWRVLGLGLEAAAAADSAERAGAVRW